MTLMARELKASFAFVERNFNLTKRYWGWEFAWRIYSIAGALGVSLVERGGQMVFVIQSVLLLVSGVYYPISVLPGWMQAVSHFSPATYVLDGVRAGLIEGTPITSLFADVWPLLVMGAVLIPLGMWTFGRAERYAKRTGKFKRVG